ATSLYRRAPVRRPTANDKRKRECEEPNRPERRRAVAGRPTVGVCFPSALPSLPPRPLRRRAAAPAPVRARPRGGLPLSGGALANDRGRASEHGGGRGAGPAGLTKAPFTRFIM